MNAPDKCQCTGKAKEVCRAHPEFRPTYCQFELEAEQEPDHTTKKLYGTRIINDCADAEFQGGE